MAIIVDHFQRREGKDPEALGIAAYEYCRAVLTNPGMQSCRYYWVNLDLIVIRLHHTPPCLVQTASSSRKGEPPSLVVFAPRLARRRHHDWPAGLLGARSRSNS